MIFENSKDNVSDLSKKQHRPKVKKSKGQTLQQRLGVTFSNNIHLSVSSKTDRDASDNDPKDMEYCDCGLRFQDCKLPLGWTVHRSCIPTTQNHIFFQSSSATTWEMPHEILPELTNKQLEFILDLYCQSNQQMPQCLMERRDQQKERMVSDTSEMSTV